MGKSKTSELVFVALGGIGEIGMNAYLYGHGPADARQWLMVDLGITFPTDAEPGVDIILPDIRFIEEERTNLLALVLTHAHEDHFGAVIELWPKLKVPIYATPFTAALLKAKLAEQQPGLKLPIKEIPLGGRFQIGPFDLELITVAHSIPEPNGIAIRTDVGRVFHSGDWKLDPTPLIGRPTDEKRIKAFAAEGIDALICDSTNALREGFSPSETDVTAKLIEIIGAAKKRVIVTTFASNVGRIRAVADATKAAGRHLVVIGRAMHRVMRVGMETGYLPKGMKYLDQREFGYLERDEVVALVTGSQGEARAALSRIAEESHPDVSLAKGDMVIFSSRNIPGNETGIGRVQNSLADMGCQIITDSDALVHVTGHPRRGELRLMYEWCHPRAAIPMHGEARHLEEHARLARAAGVKEIVHARNGSVVRIAPGVAEIIDDVPVGRKHRDGRLIVSSDDGPSRNRRKLSAVGIVVVSLVMTRQGEIEAEPQVMLDGVPQADADGVPMAEIVLDAVNGALQSIPKSRRKDMPTVQEAARRAARSAVDQVWGKKPICKVLLTVI